MLKVQDVTRKMGKEAVLGPIDLHISPGTITAIVANNGAGKTTLFQAISGDYPGFGSVRVDGHSVHSIAGKAQLSYVPQTYPEVEAFRLTDLQKLHKEHDFSWQDDRFQAIARQFKLPMKKPIQKLSVGMKQKAVIATQLSRKTNVKLLDEPFAGLDMEGQSLVERLLLEELEANPNATIIFATHVADEVQRLADYVCFMHAGKLSEPVEKDWLQERWKYVWLQEALPGNGPSARVEEVSVDPMPKILTRNALETEEWVRENGGTVVKRSSLRLHESIPHILRKGEQNDDE
ncbi:ABC transporter ATP-binding protein [Geomicrobium sp. JCM 19039]|uniref:ATP-binding cassette domain-containing protein n=1 Tax=Geomicrobium sp. JCM 19039 TaxID=1460636 RepID=UPI00045F3C82|nr:ABC transporter ATP-binding protein [Geomicrobium sp. JCM 19039]GAK13772.1 ABC transporter, ATP-binding protein [Geomicrobium sp. JCM 19039]